MKIWLKSPDPSHQCCGCESKTGPCDNCCVYTVPIGGEAQLNSLAEAEQRIVDCVYLCRFYVPFADNINQVSNIILNLNGYSFSASCVIGAAGGNFSYGTSIKGMFKQNDIITAIGNVTSKSTPFGTIFFLLQREDLTDVGSISSFTSFDTQFTIPQDGNYILTCLNFPDPGSAFNFCNADFSISISENVTFCPIRVAYTQSGNEQFLSC